MQPYVIRQGDYLAKLAHKFGFDADAVWAHAKNAALREARTDPNILAPTDILYIPEPGPTKWWALKTGTTNTFVSDCPTKTITIQFLDHHLASRSCIIAELDHLTGLATDGNGRLKFEVPVRLMVATVTLSDLEEGVTCVCRIGHIDPLNSLSGIWQRLQNLGHVHPDLDPSDLAAVRTGLRALKYSLPEGPGGSESNGDLDSSDFTDDSRADDGTEAGPTYNEGLDDDGVLDARVAKRLLVAHGS
jgi:hypothetical protein